MKLVTARAILGCHGQDLRAKKTPCTSDTGSSRKQARATARWSSGRPLTSPSRSSIHFSPLGPLGPPTVPFMMYAEARRWASSLLEDRKSPPGLTTRT